MDIRLDWRGWSNFVLSHIHAAVFLLGTVVIVAAIAGAAVLTENNKDSVQATTPAPTMTIAPRSSRKAARKARSQDDRKTGMRRTRKRPSGENGQTDNGDNGNTNGNGSNGNGYQSQSTKE